MEISSIIEKVSADAKSLIHLQEQSKLVKLINRGIILGKTEDNLATELVREGSGNYMVTEIARLIRTVKTAIATNSTHELSLEDLMHAEKIIIGAFSKDPEVKPGELLKDIQVALSTTAHEEEIRDIIKQVRARHLVDFESLGIDTRFKPTNKNFYISDVKEDYFVGIGPNNSRPFGHVLGFAPNKLFMLGYKDGILKQDYTRNHYAIRPIYILQPEGRILKKVNNKIICKGAAIAEIPDSLAIEIGKKFSHNTVEIVIGASLAGGRARSLNGKVQLERIPLRTLLDNLQARVLITGKTGDGKTIWANQIYRQLMDLGDYLQGGTVSITRDVDNLSNAGARFTAFSPNWDEDNRICAAITEQVNLAEKPDFMKVTISSDSRLPDINKLSKETLFSMIDNSECSVQVKTALKRHIEEAVDVVDVFEKAKKGELLGDEYTSSQDSALRRLMNSLIPVNYETVEKIDLKEVLDNNKHVGFFLKGLNADTYGTMIVHELYNLQKEKGVRNPLKEGRLLLIDEVQKYIRFKAFQDVFEMCVLDGRGFGIMVMGIIQSQEQAAKLCSYKDFILYSAETLDDGTRIINIDDKIAIIAPLAPEVA
jgi:hypothetical protein